MSLISVFSPQGGQTCGENCGTKEGGNPSQCISKEVCLPDGLSEGFAVFSEIVHKSVPRVISLEKICCKIGEVSQGGSFCWVVFARVFHHHVLRPPTICKRSLLHDDQFSSHSAGKRP